jgi:tetratricopeptide (TPR) repeat protein
MKDDPEVRARLLTTLGGAHLNLALDDEGLALLREALVVADSTAPDDVPQRVRQLYELAHGLRVAGRRHDEEIGRLMDRAFVLLRESGENQPELLALCLRIKAAWLNDRGDRAPADSLIRRAIDITEGLAHPDTLELISMYATRGAIASGDSRREDQESYYLHALALSEAFDQAPTWTIQMHQRLAQFYSAALDVEKAVSHAEKGARLARQIYPADHPGLAAALNGQVEALISLGRQEEAIDVGEEHARILRKSARRLELALPLNTLGILYHAVGRFDLGIARSEEAFVIFRESYGPENHRTAEMLLNLARNLAAAGHSARAESAYRATIAIYNQHDPASIYNGFAYGSYANLCRDAGRFPQAETLYARAESLFDSTDVSTRRALADFVVDHGYMRSLEGRHAEAEAMIANGFRLWGGDGDKPDREMGALYLRWAAARAGAGDSAAAIEKLRRASAMGLDADDADRYPELAPLRSRPDYPLARST